MAVEGNDKRVRAQIDAIVDAQEFGAVVAPQKHGVSKNALVIILTCFCVVIVGLVIAILAVNRPWEQQPEIIEPNIADTTENVVLINCSDLLYRLSTDGEFTVDDALEELDAAAEFGDDTYKIYTAICYANIISSIDRDVQLAIDKMLVAEPLLADEDDSVKIDFYATLRSLYGQICSEQEKYEYYNNLIDEMLGDEDISVTPQYELESGGEQ